MRQGSQELGKCDCLFDIYILLLNIVFFVVSSVDISVSVCIIPCYKIVTVLLFSAQ